MKGYYFCNITGNNNIEYKKTLEKIYKKICIHQKKLIKKYISLKICTK